VDTTHETLYLDKLSFVHKQIMEIPTSFIWIIILFDEAFRHGDVESFWGYVGTNAETFCVEFCNFVQWRTLVYHVGKVDTLLLSRAHCYSSPTLPVEQTRVQTYNACLSGGDLVWVIDVPSAILALQQLTCSAVCLHVNVVIKLSRPIYLSSFSASSR
jgi:hypothetical protein